MAEQLLRLKIELGKERLEDLAGQLGHTHKRVIAYSQRLDRLIVEWQKMVRSYG
ncbi:aspartyl-phosphate phosphatase Spo0E family protein [Desulfofalx alkaliphila]|uniref:aspartyl-phosphate phosphatase Spo0E family protein n=1 Tax=Desulfofalx alkaliphila TaxID=105483 RepID=UPI000A684181|nr:aspartyl-phosphate phosphatase Spo0E family protein [Desulfofalx alkaliphila]